ncbi:hypothetical protein RUM44_012252 [Polyplax serrata]|uniref:Glucose-methanol-choline oxidoreductase N-terminal domain-containing protein n=1 Tax=Polyplax serrata TaxID=468196 RepID=A0ABR1BAT3_POLSC
MLLASHCTLGTPDDYPMDFGNGLMANDEFDFIIVGGGSAGSVIASRLTEIPKWKVLLVEAGGNPTFESDMPGFALSVPGTEMDWNFKMRPNENLCLAMENNTCIISQGRVMGGTSTINGMHYFRGNPADYDEWERLVKKGWGYKSVLEYFKKSEKLDDDFKMIGDGDTNEMFEESKKQHRNDDWKLHLSSKVASEKYHSKGGVMGVNHFAYDVSLARMKRRLCEAAEELGVPHKGDINTKHQIGCVEAMAVLHEASRGNAAKNFLQQVKDRPNLHVVKNATVEKLIIDGSAVKGVELTLNEKILPVFARKEVILSAGAINSPRLLLLSGIGPKKQLQGVGVDVHADLPGVGKNLQMQISFYGIPIAVEKERSKPFKEIQKIDEMYHFVSRGYGKFGNVGLNDVATFISTTNETVPDIQLSHHFNYIRDHYTFSELLLARNVRDEIRNLFAKTYAKSNVLLIIPTLLRPDVRGQVSVDSHRFDVPPKVSIDFLRNEDDVERLLRGIKMAVRVTETKSFKEFSPQVLKLEIEECVRNEFKSDEYWRCLLRYLATPTNEVAGTCKMGAKDDPFAVVDGELKVIGVRGLRVADSSVMPTIVRGSTSVASIMIAEKVSDLIKNDWQKGVRKDEL